MDIYFKNENNGVMYRVIDFLIMSFFYKVQDEVQRFRNVVGMWIFNVELFSEFCL